MNWLGLGNSFQLFVAYALVAIIVTALVVWRAKSRRGKWLAGITSIALFWGLTRIDDILGAREHRALCEKYAGVKVYKQVILPAEFYYPDGRPRFMGQTNHVVYEPALKDCINFKWGGQDSYSTRYLKIDKTVAAIIDARTGELVAELVSFRRWPSPFMPSILHGGAISCDKLPQAAVGSTGAFHRQVFPNLVTKKGKQ